MASSELCSEGSMTRATLELLDACIEVQATKSHMDLGELVRDIQHLTARVKAFPKHDIDPKTALLFHILTEMSTLLPSK